MVREGLVPFQSNSHSCLRCNHPAYCFSVQFGSPPLTWHLAQLSTAFLLMKKLLGFLLKLVRMALWQCFNIKNKCFCTFKYTLHYVHVSTAIYTAQCPWSYVHMPQDTYVHNSAHQTVVWTCLKKHVSTVLLIKHICAYASDPW